ncbi:hypothetical protein [Achromobacter insolitus]|uniref:Uncharacterized protein n=1 Tax=Achromobacter insolitus TaxID=217204 RepID=A0A6S7EZY1_9BURK|nr:hypothetical protein [Achromobacter insolitus]CAB3931554.1 hypothetical protein LMG6000_02212 [Achromobacter insolitus]CAB3939425.1 hypothetical protein LMG5997_04029 [Achromobacter insolitus]
MTDETKTALLSKLRAPVADERAVRIPVPFSVDTTHKNQAFVTLGFYDEALRKEFVRAVCSGGFRVPTAALASAPVATPIQWPTMPESKGQSPVLFEDGYAEGWAKCMDECRRAVEQASAPVAGEAQPTDAEIIDLAVEPLGIDCDRIPHGVVVFARNLLSRYAAPQASEAVRIVFPTHLRKMWSGGDVQAWLDEHQGVTAPKPSAKGSLERYRKWQADRDEAFGSGVKAAADLVKKMVDDYDTDHGSTDPETGTREYPGEGATWVCEMRELEESIRALSAQPEAQKEQSDE